MNESENKTKLNKLKSKLYAQESESLVAHEEVLHEADPINVNTDWGGVPQDEKGSDEAIFEEKDVPMAKKKKKRSIADKLLWIGVIFLLIAGGYAAYTFSGGIKTFSNNNIDIAIDGPILIAAGEPLILDVKITNNNNVTLETVDLLVEFPEGTRDTENITEEIKRTREVLGTLKAGEFASTTIEAALFGEQGEIKTIEIGIEYRGTGSNATFYKNVIYEVEIGSSPVSLVVSGPDEVNSGQEVEFVVDVIANSEEEVDDLLLVIEYPFGFEFIEGSPEPTFDEDIWYIGNLKPLEEQRIRVKGKITSQDTDERVVTFNLGIQSDRNEKVVGTHFIKQTETVAITKPFLDLDVVVNGDSGNEIGVTGGNTARVDIVWKNSLSESVTDVVIEARIEGSAVDKTKISSPGGFYRSVDDVIVWDAQTDSNFAVVEAGERGQVSFTVPIRSIAELVSSGKATDINLSVTARARQPQNVGAPTTIVNTLNRTLAVISEINLLGRVVHFSGPFNNSGPMPPRVNQETTYTVIWSVSNPLNDVDGAKVRAVLPPYVEFLGAVSPSVEVVDYNPVGGTIEWDLGRINSGTGYSLPAREVAFQVSLTPSITQQGERVLLINRGTLTGTDMVTGKSIGDSISELDTYLDTDPSFRNGQEIITP